MKRAAAYARFSSDRQNELSNKDQLDNIAQFAKTNGFRVVRTYQDEELSGFLDAEHREGLRTLLLEAKKYNFQYVLVWNFDRFARSRRIAQNLKEELRKKGLELISVTQTLPSGSGRVLVESLYEGVAEWYSWNLAENVMRGTLSSIKRGGFAGINAPFGYTNLRDSKGKRQIVVNEETASIVREVFMKYLNGETLFQIAMWLNKQGYSTIRGNPYSMRAISWMLTNPIYKGIIVFNNKGRRGGEKNPYKEVITIEHPELTIISPKIWDEVQKRRCVYRGARSQKTYLLKHLIKCAKCGHYILRHPRGKNEKTKRYEIDPGRNYYCAWCRHHLGRSGMIGEKKLNKIVMDYMKEIFDIIVENAEDFTARVNEGLRKKKESLKFNDIMTELAEINLKIENITTAIEKGRGLDILLDKLESLQDEKNKAEMNFREARALEKEYKELNPNIIRKDIERFREMLLEEKTAHEMLKELATMKLDLDKKILEITVFKSTSEVAVT